MRLPLDNINSNRLHRGLLTQLPSNRMPEVSAPLDDLNGIFLGICLIYMNTFITIKNT